jgi:hypothetical protein
MLRSLAVSAVLLLVVVPAAWAGTTYYATPLTANTTTCDAANPCTLEAAVGKAVNGDTVQLAPGEYHRGGGGGSWLTVPVGTTLQGAPGAQRPTILQEDPYTSCACPILLSNGGVTFRHLVVDQSVDSGGSGGLSLAGGDEVEDVLSIGGKSGGAVSSAGTGQAEIRGSLFIGPLTGLYAAGSAHLEHATLVGTGSTGVGLRAQLLAADTIAVVVDNSIVQGGTSGHDVTAATGDPGAHVIVTAHYSAISRSSGDASGTGAEQFDFSDHVIATDPIFNPGGFGVTAGSPTIDAGSAALTTVPLDFDRLPRILGPAPDMGAFEYAPAPGTSASASDVTETTATLSGSVTSALPADAHFEYGLDASYGTVAGAASLPGAASPAAIGAALTGLAAGTTYHYRLVASNAHGTTATPDATFTTASAPPTTTPRDTTPPHVTKLTVRWPRIRLVLDESARVTFTIGKRHWTRKLKAGATTIKPPRRVRRALRHGRYRLRVVAVDASGNRSAAVRRPFRIR